VSPAVFASGSLGLNRKFATIIKILPSPPISPKIFRSRSPTCETRTLTSHKSLFLRKTLNRALGSLWDPAGNGLKASDEASDQSNGQNLGEFATIMIGCAP
jgi:hypothetical protein